MAYPPAVSVRKSLGSRDHILSMIDGKPYKTLKRHLGQHGLTPAQYRERYGLKSDYPMVAPAYSEARKAMALKIGLGQKIKKAANAATTSATTLKAQPEASSTASPRARAPAKCTARQADGTVTKPAATAAAKTAARVTTKALGGRRAQRGRPPKAGATPSAEAAE